MNKTKKTALLGKSGKFYALGIAVILIIALAHFAGQMFFIQNENLRALGSHADVEAPPLIENGRSDVPAPTAEKSANRPDEISEKLPPAAPQTNASAKLRRTSAGRLPAAAKPQIRQSEEIVPVRETISRKKTTRETRADRLRRAERLLTGV